MLSLVVVVVVVSVLMLVLVLLSEDAEGQKKLLASGEAVQVTAVRSSLSVQQQQPAALVLSQRVYESVSLGDSLPSNRAWQRMSLKSDL